MGRLILGGATGGVGGTGVLQLVCRVFMPAAVPTVLRVVQPAMLLLLSYSGGGCSIARKGCCCYGGGSAGACSAGVLARTDN